MRTLLAAAVAAWLAAPAAAQVVHGRVVAAGADSSVAVAGAAVRLVGRRGADSASAAADSAGGFVLRAPRAGRYRLAADGPGLRAARTREMALREGDSLEVVIRLSPDTVLLDPLQVVATRHRRPTWVEEFYRRAEKDAHGWFVTREQIERRRASQTSDLLWMAPGIRLVAARRGGGYQVRGRGGCVPAVFVDGVRVPGGAAAIDLWTTPRELEGIEIYHGSEVPVEYAEPGSGCAVILFWTRFEA